MGQDKLNDLQAKGQAWLNWKEAYGSQMVGTDRVIRNRSNIEIDPLYAPQAPAADYLDTHGYPGQFPFTRGILYGGGISIGHPPGATGVRMALTAIDHLQDTGGCHAILSMCLWAGQGMAVLMEGTAFDG